MSVIYEANGKLYQFKRILFEVTNGVSCFQHGMDDIIKNDALRGIYPYLNNVTVVGATQEKYDVKFGENLGVDTSLQYRIQPR